MPDVTNTEIAAALDELGDLSELDGAAVYRVVAYRNAAKAVREAPGPSSRRRSSTWRIRAPFPPRSSCGPSSRPG